MARPTKPALQVCPLCVTDDNVTLESDGPDLWTFTCSEGRHHPNGGGPYTWHPKSQPEQTSARSGLGDELGIYNTLLACVTDTTPVEYGIVEYRFAERDPDAYRQLVDTYGHRSDSTGLSYTASAFLAHALGQLEREGLLTKTWTRGTDYWEYLQRVSAWSILPGDPTATTTSWTDFALTLGIEPETWPPTGYH